jgi:hypothetical protein
MLYGPIRSKSCFRRIALGTLLTNVVGMAALALPVLPEGCVSLLVGLGRDSYYETPQIRIFLSDQIDMVLKKHIHLSTEVGFDNGLIGSFIPPNEDGWGYRGGMIDIIHRRSFSIYTQQQIADFVGTAERPLDSLLTLAHEFGHYWSYTKGERTSGYEEALRLFNYGNPMSPMSDEHKAFILSEEDRAWCYGAGVLFEIGFADVDCIEHAKKIDLEKYKKKLGLNLE